jgi:hypothetical protein
MRRFGPRPDRHCIEARREVGHLDNAVSAERDRERPTRIGAGRVKRHDLRTCALPRLGPGRSRQSRVRTVWIDQVEKCERDILAVPGKRLHRDAACFFGSVLRRLRAQIAQNGNAALGNDLLADLVHRGEHASDTARRGGVGRRTVGNGKVRLLGEARTLDVKLKIFNPGGRSAAERRVDQGLEDVPDFGPALADGQTQRIRVLEAENWNVGIVINANVVGPPPQQHGKPVGQHQTDGGAQGRRPALGWP